MNNSLDDIWELAERSVREARVLRSFLEYLRLGVDSQDKKWNRIQHWRAEVGLQLGNPEVTDTARVLFQTLRGLPPEMRQVAVRKTLEEADSLYFSEETHDS